jgi:hypothetical protein
LSGSAETSCPVKYQKQRGHFNGVGLHYTGLSAAIRVPAGANAVSAHDFLEIPGNLRRLG